MFRVLMLSIGIVCFALAGCATQKPHPKQAKNGHEICKEVKMTGTRIPRKFCTKKKSHRQKYRTQDDQEEMERLLRHNYTADRGK